MSPTPTNRGSRYPSLAAAAQTEWYIDSIAGNDDATGESGSPLLTYRELAKRVGGQRLIQPTTIRLINGLLESDYIVALACGPGGSVTVSSAPQAAVSTGTLTGVAAASGNAPATITDTSRNWSAYVGYTLRATSGSNYGVECKIARNLGSGVAEIVWAQDLDPAGYTTVLLEVGDDYQLESPPAVAAIVFPYPCSGAPPVGTTVVARLILRGLNFAAYGVPMHVPHMGAVTDVQFFGCNMPAVADGTYTAIGCSFAAGATWDSGATVLRSCLIFGSPVIGRGATADWSGDTLVTGGTGMHVAGTLTVSGDVRVCNSSGIGLTVDIGGTVVCSPSAAIRGAGHTGLGLWIMPGGRLYYDLASSGLPKITGSDGDLKVSGLRLGYNSILHGQPDAVSIDGAILARYGTTAYAIPLSTPFTACITMFGIAAGAEVVGCIATLPINGPSLTVPANSSGQGFVAKFLQAYSAAGASFDIIVEWWVGTSLYFGVCGFTRDTDGAEGQHFSIGSSSPYTFVAGIGGDLRVRIINNGLTPLPPITTIIWT